ncbi:MAG: hypothetical protein ACYDH3_02815 [Candidatus Aminicenantales bacterium]
MSLGFWDIALLVLVGGQATLLSYLRHPKWKALILALPIPFTLAALAVGSPVNTTHLAALTLLLAYTHGVRLLHNRAGLPILPSILLSAAGYCGIGVLLRPLMPQSETAFWLACVLTLGIAVLTHAMYTCPEEPGHRTHLPVWIKFPLVVGIIFLLILIKGLLGGFMTMFPMVGVIASYEARTSLGAVCRAMPDFMFAMVPMLAVVHLVQPKLGLGPALLLGWLVFLPMLAPLIRDFWKPKTPPSLSH